MYRKRRYANDEDYKAYSEEDVSGYDFEDGGILIIFCGPVMKM